MNLKSVQQFIASRPVLPAVLLSESGGQWSLGHSSLKGPHRGPPLDPRTMMVVEAVACSAAALHSQGDSPCNASAAAGGGGSGALSLLAAGARSHIGEERAASIVKSALEPPLKAVVQQMLQRLGVGLLSQRVVRQVVVSYPQDGRSAGAGGGGDKGGRNQHHAHCSRVRAVFPLVQRFLIKVRFTGKRDESVPGQLTRDDSCTPSPYV